MQAFRLFLLPLSLLYAAVIVLRNWFFDTGILQTTKISVPVISVGNISAGGTGKTPLVEYLARRFRDRGKKVAIVSRGYQRNTRGYVVVSNGRQRCAEAFESGDEPSQLAEKLDGVVVVVDEDRVRAAKTVAAEFGVQVVLLDDGFQHRYVHRDFNIAVVPADELSARTWLIPAGNRRESYGALHRAHLVVVSRCKDEQALRSASGQLAQWTNGPVVGMRMQPVSFRNALDGVPKEMIELVGKKVVAFSGIGNPTSFEESLRSLSVDVRLHHRFTDHHRYTAGELEKIKSSFQNEQGDFIVTTEKDVARLRGEKNIAAAFFEQNPVYYLEIQPVFVAGEDVWKKYLEKF